MSICLRGCMFSICALNSCKDTKQFSLCDKNSVPKHVFAVRPSYIMCVFHTFCEFDFFDLKNSSYILIVNNITNFQFYLCYENRTIQATSKHYRRIIANITKISCPTQILAMGIYQMKSHFPRLTL